MSERLTVDTLAAINGAITVEEAIDALKAYRAAILAERDEAVDGLVKSLDSILTIAGGAFEILKPSPGFEFFGDIYQEADAALAEYERAVRTTRESTTRSG